MPIETTTITKADGAAHDQNVQDFLTEFINAATSGDVKKAASMWESPAYALADDMEKLVQSRNDAEGFFGGAKEQYNKQGITGSRPEIQRLEWVTSRMAIVSVRWPYLDEKGNEKGAESSTYVLRKNDAGELKFKVGVMQGMEASLASAR